ncbi:MAG: helix-hairpin-helix domain-containing protein [Chloroflexota bacterium]
MLDGVVIPIQQMVYSMLYFVAETLWGINQAILLVGYYVLSITAWLSQQMFQPLLTSIGNATDSLLLPVFTVAMVTLAITYLLGVFGVFRVVEFKSAVVWCAVAVMWFQFGPEIYLGFEGFRRDISGGFYGTAFTDLTGAGGSMEGMGQIGDAGDMQIDPPINNFGRFLSFDTSIDGLDVALAYLDADGCDVLRTAGCLFQPLPNDSDGRLPLMWYQSDGYFNINQHPFFFQFAMTQTERQQSLDDAARGIWIAFSGIVVSLFGLLEQIIQLLLTIAFGIAFASFFIAILFAFFKKTESITWGVFDIILGLFIQSIITSLLLALVMAFVSLAGVTGNGILLLGVGFLGIILITILLISAVQAILGAVNGLLGAFGKATGGNLDAAGSVTRVATAYATGGATLMAGGSVAQTAGALLGPGASQKAYYASRAFGSDTLIGRTANDVAQGATAAYLGPVGGYALGRAGTNEIPSPREVAGNMISSTGNIIANMTLGTPIRAIETTPTLGPNLRQQAAEGADIRHDPLTTQAYAFTAQANGQGQRTYEDSSRLYTTPEDVPLNRERAREENRARRRSDTTQDDLSDTAVARIDASDDDENAALLTATQGGNTQVSSIPSRENDEADTPHERTRTVLSQAPGNEDEEAPITQTAISGHQTSAEAFLADVEQAHPGVTGREDLIARYFPGGDGSQDTQVAQIAIMSEDSVRNLNTDDVIRVPQVGPATQDRLADVDITTAGALAGASVETLGTVGIGERRAAFLIGQAQNYVDNPVVASGSSPTNNTDRSGSAVSQDAVASPAQIAAAQDAANNDDAVRLANGVGIAVGNAMGGRVPTTAQSSRLASQAGLPDVPQTTQFLQVASAMGLSGTQAQTVIQDVQQQDALGTEVTGSIRASLSTLTLAHGGQLDTTGMAQAVSLLEGAARSLVNATQSMNNTDHSRIEAEAATIGSTRPQTTSQ